MRGDTVDKILGECRDMYSNGIEAYALFVSREDPKSLEARMQKEIRTIGLIALCSKDFSKGFALCEKDDSFIPKMATSIIGLTSLFFACFSGSEKTKDTKELMLKGLKLFDWVEAEEGESPLLESPAFSLDDVIKSLKEDGENG